MESNKVGNGFGARLPQQGTHRNNEPSSDGRTSPSPRPSVSAPNELLELPTRISDTKDVRPRNLSKSSKLAYVVAEVSGGYKKYRKVTDKPVFRPSPLSGKEPVNVPVYGKGALFQSGQIHEMIALVARPTEGTRSYQLKPQQLMKVLGWGEGPDDKEYPLAAGTSRPDVPIMTDGMAVCSAIVVGATSPDKRRAKLKVFHIQPELNTKGLEAVQTYVARLQALGLTEMNVAMHGGNQYPAEKQDEKIREKHAASKFRALFDQPGINVELDELAAARGAKNSPLGGVIEQINAEGEPPQYGIRIFNEIAGAP